MQSSLRLKTGQWVFHHNWQNTSQLTVTGKKKNPQTKPEGCSDPNPQTPPNKCWVWCGLPLSQSHDLLLKLLLPSGGTAHHTKPHLPIIWKDTIRWATSREILSYWVLEFTRRQKKNQNSVGLAYMNSFTVCTNLLRKPQASAAADSPGQGVLCMIKLHCPSTLSVVKTLFLTLVISQAEKHKIKVHREEPGTKPEQKPIKGPPTLVSAALALEGKLKALHGAWSGRGHVIGRKTQVQLFNFLNIYHSDITQYKTQSCVPDAWTLLSKHILT